MFAKNSPLGTSDCPRVEAKNLQVLDDLRDYLAVIANLERMWEFPTKNHCVE